MTRKKISLFLVFICLFFIHFKDVSADEPSTLIVDFSSLENSYNDYFITDNDTGRVFHKFELFDWIIDNYGSKYSFMIFPSSEPKAETLDLIIYVGNSNFNYNYYVTRENNNLYNFRMNGEWHDCFFNGNVWDGTGDGISSFSLSQFKNFLDNMFINWESDNSTLLYPWFWSPDFTISGGSSSNFFPYYSNLKGYFSSYDANSDLVINAFHSNAHQNIIAKGDDIAGFFYISASKVIDENAPVPDISFSDVITDDNNIVTSVTATINFSVFNGAYRNKYSFNNNETTIEERTSFSISSNGLLSARSCSKTDNICYNKKSYNIDFIGKDKGYFDDFMQNVYFDNLVGDEPVLTSSSGVNDYLNWYVYHFKKTYPIILQLKDLITMFDTRTSSGIHDNQPLPSFNINLGFLGINQNYNIFDLSILLPYKDRIYNLIKYICALYTFISVINLVKEMTDNS